MDCIIGVDIGTTSTKAIAFTTTGQILYKHAIEYPLFNPKPTWSEQSCEQIFNAVINSIKEVALKNSQHNLLGISFSCAMHSLIAMDSEGNALTNCIIWADTRSNSYAEELKNTPLGNEMYNQTGTPIHPMSPLCKLLWLRDNQPQIFAKAEKFISIKEYVIYKLFGAYIVDYGIASCTGLFDIHELKWNISILNYIGINENKLSAIKPPTYTISGLSRNFSNLMGISPTTKFILGGSDGCLSNIGANAIAAGDAAVTIGTSGAIRVISKKAKTDNRIFCYVLTEEHYVLGGAVNNGGIALNWFKENFYDTNNFSDLSKEAESISAGANGLIFLPYILGERAPNWNANAKGVFFGINITHTKQHFLRAVLEGIIFGIYDVGTVLTETTGNINSIFATGGFVRSQMWVQMLSDVFNKHVCIAESYESSCLGAAVIGMKALGIIDNIEEVKSMVPITKVFTPNLHNHEIYMQNYGIYKRLYKSLVQEFDMVRKIQQ